MGAYEAKKGLEARFILPDLQALIRGSASQSSAAAKAGISESCIRHILTGRTTRVSYTTAQKIGEVVRGSRGLDEDWGRDEHKREMQEARRIREREAYRRHDRPLGRRQTIGDDFVCIHCGGKAESDHALYMHSRAMHQDITQGRNRWSRLKR